MQLTRFTDIGLRVVMALAADARTPSGGTSLTTRGLADDLALPYAHAAKVVGRLAEMGMLEARRGRSGGLTVTAAGRTARVGRLAAALEGDGEVVSCDGSQPCPLRSACRLRSALARARSAFFDALDEYTVADLVAEPTGALLLSLTTQPRTPLTRETSR